MAEQQILSQLSVLRIKVAMRIASPNNFAKAGNPVFDGNYMYVGS